MKRTLTLVALATILATPAFAQIGVAIRAGTLGPGINVAYGISDKLAVRATGSYLTYSINDSIDEEVTVDLEGEATIGAVGVAVDYHPFGNFFRLSGGLNVNLFEVSGTGLPTGSYCLGDGDAAACDGKLFAPNRLGSFGATLSYSSAIAPYAGIGFGRVAGKQRIGLLLDIGALYTGSPEIDLDGSGLLAPTASPEQENTLNQGIESFQWFPVVSVGVAVRI
ncbi:MAG: hypothetical protein ACI9W4_001231 [Rhodothermales bacterium]|jgi:hypothetical protein